MRLTVIAIALVLAGCGGSTTVRSTPPVGEPPARSGPWVAQTSTAAGARSLATPRLALQPGGGGLVAVQGESVGPSSCESADPNRAFVGRVTPGGRVGPLRPLRANLSAGPVALPAGRAAAVLSEPRPGSTDCAPSADVTLADLDSAGRVTGRDRLMGTEAELWDLDLAAEREGTLVVAWIETVGDALTTVRAAVRPAGGRLSRPLRIEGGAGAVLPQNPLVSDVAVAVTPEGYALVAYASVEGVFAVTLDGDGRRVRRVRVGPAAAVTDLALAVGAAGEAVVVWGGQDGGEERELPYVVRAATRRRGALRFGAAQVIDPGGAIESVQNRPVAHVDGHGRAFVAWENVRRSGSGQRFGVFATRAPLGERFPRAVGVAGGFFVDGAAPGGRPLVLTTDDEGRVDAHRASAADPLRFGRGERVSEDRAYRASIAEARGRPFVTWSAGPERRPFVRVARRRGA